VDACCTLPCRDSNQWPVTKNTFNPSDFKKSSTVSQATSYYCNNVRERAACNKLMARMLRTSRLRYDVVRLSAKLEREEHVPYYEGWRGCIGRGRRGQWSRRPLKRHLVVDVDTFFWKVREYKRPIPVTARSKAARLLGLRFESRLGSDVCCQVEISESGWSLVQMSSTECGMSKWVWARSLDKEKALAT
jgi:hypothetical protein